MRLAVVCLSIVCILTASVAYAQGNKDMAGDGTFKSDADFLKAHTKAVFLGEGNSQLVVVPEYQGRVMTSTASGPKGISLGWINRELIASGEVKAHLNPYGGEDRFWIGPEGGQFGVFFAPGAEFDTEVWQTPAPIDTEPFELVSKKDNEATFRREFEVTNWSGTKFKLGVDRTVKLLDRAAAVEAAGTEIPESVDLVAFESQNKLTNTGDAAWQKETGLLSIWILGMLVPSPATTVVIPIREGAADQMGPEVNADYFGKVPAERLTVKDNTIFFSADGQQRGKIGVTPQRSKGIAGSYDAKNGILTLVTFTAPEGVTEYVNSMWEQQEKPYAGDVINSYNDGPLGPGQPPLGPFYEIETSSPALALAPGASYTHVHRTIHLVGKEADLNPIAEKALGVSLKQIEDAL